MPCQIIVEDKRDKTIFPSVGHVADYYGLTRKHVARTLEQKKHLKVGCRTTNIYRKNTHSRSITMGGIPFGSFKSAANYFEVSVSTLRRRIQANNPVVRHDVIITSLNGEKFPPQKNTTQYTPWWSFITLFGK